jgi:hypothetical protein
MVVLEIGMLSGYSPDKAELTKDIDELRNAGEPSSSSVIFYHLPRIFGRSPNLEPLVIYL